MAAARIATVAVLLLAAPSIGAITGMLQDDAGSGSDAPDDRNNALSVQPDSYEGDLMPHDQNLSDADWYEIADPDASTQKEKGPGPNGLTCTEVQVSTSEAARLDVVEPSIEGAAVNTTIEEGNVSLGMVGPDDEGTLVGVMAVDLHPLAPYTFDIEIQRVNAITKGPTMVAGNSRAEVPAPCFGASLDGEDPKDTWTVDLEENATVLVTYASQGNRPDRLQLVDPDGDTVRNLSSTGDVALTQLEVSKAGTWRMEAVQSEHASSNAEMPYLIGLAILDDPEEEEEEEKACRPHCME